MEYDRFAARIGADYEMLQQALSGAYLASTAPGADRSPMQKVKLHTAGARLALHFIQQAELLVADYVEAVTHGQPSEPIATRSAFFISSLRMLVTQNVRDMTKRYAAGNLNLGAVLRDPAGAIGNLLQNRLGSLNATDTAGRTWRAAKLVAVLSRDFAYQSAIDAQVAHLAQQGDLAMVVYTNPDHVHHGLIVSFSGDDPRGEPLARVRDTIFHPNASAELRHVSS